MILIAHIGSLLTLVAPRQTGADRDTLHRFGPFGVRRRGGVTVGWAGRLHLFRRSL